MYINPCSIPYISIQISVFLASSSIPLFFSVAGGHGLRPRPGDPRSTADEQRRAVRHHDPHSTGITRRNNTQVFNVIHGIILECMRKAVLLFQCSTFCQTTGHTVDDDL